MDRIKIVGKGGKCEVCETLVGVKVVQVGAHVIALCECCRDSVSKVISVDMLEDRVMPDEYRKPVCNFCGRVGEIDEQVKDVCGYKVLSSCTSCEKKILEGEDY